MDGFQIIGKLGEGSYSTVLKVKRLEDNNIYALKKVKLLKLKTKEKTNALNEVRILASIKSNYVISYKEAFFDEKESCLGIVMEFADNGDLYQKITEYKKLNKYFEEDEIWKILIQLIKGLKSLHELKILHRDIKSANVFLFKNGSAKLGDLNVSKIVKKGLVYTQTGTPYYASPEVWKDLPYDNKSDIWSLGCVLYEIITLKPPFRAQNMQGLYNKVIKGFYNKIPNFYSSDLSDIVNLLLQVDSNKRPSCENLLKNPIILKRIEYFNNFNSNEEEDNSLLKTITIPKNLLFLSLNLPQSNYNNKIKINQYRSFSNESNGEILPNVISPNNTVDHDNDIIKRVKNNDKIKGEVKDSHFKNNNRVEEHLSEKENELKRNKSENHKIELKNNEIKEINHQFKLPQIKNNYHEKSNINLLNKRKYNQNPYGKYNKYRVEIRENDPIYQLYRIYAPKLQKPYFQYGKYIIDKNKVNDNIIKNLKQYHYMYKSPLSNINRNKFSPKLNPIERNLLY